MDRRLITVSFIWEMDTSADLSKQTSELHAMLTDIAKLIGVNPGSTRGSATVEIGDSIPCVCST